ncbi:MAG TPA: hypothetical protein PLY70_08125 [Saprospiraceae bacterium]|nr:hypothetical protein [Saprospiraceae bacterium]
MNLLESKSKILFIVSGLVLFIIAVYRASTLSMTHDESSSILRLLHENNFTHLFSDKEWLTANNHWLNTLSFQIFYQVFGMNELALRMGSVLMMPIYTYAIYFIFKKMDVDFYIQILGVGLLMTNAILLDYFSLARGYAMSITFMLTAICFALKYLENQDNKILLGFAVSLLLSTMSIFSNIIFFFVFSGALGIILLRSKKLTKSFFIILLGVFVLMVILTYIPLQTLSKAEEFKWGTNTLMESFQSYFTSFVHHQKYLFSPDVLIGIFMTIILMAVVSSFMHFFQNSNTLKEQFFIFIGLSFTIFMFGMIFAKIVLKANYPIDRKCLIYLPFIGLLITLYADLYLNKSLKIILGILIGGFLIVHSYHSINKNSTWEWWYDTYTKELVAELENRTSDAPLKVNSHWMFHPTLDFYNHFFYKDKLILSPYSKDLTVDESIDYYIIFKGDFEPFKEKYEIISEQLNSQVLIKKK